MITLTCEVCDKRFAATKKRSINICPNCIKYLEPLGKGPNQLLRHPVIKPKAIEIMRAARR